MDRLATTAYSHRNCGMAASSQVVPRDAPTQLPGKRRTGARREPVHDKTGVPQMVMHVKKPRMPATSSARPAALLGMTGEIVYVETSTEEWDHDIPLAGGTTSSLAFNRFTARRQ